MKGQVGAEAPLGMLRIVLPFPLQDLAWMLSFYARIFFTYMPLLGLKGFLGLFFIVRYGHVVECNGWQGKYKVTDGSGGRAGPWGSFGPLA